MTPRKLLTAVLAVALFAASTSFAQESKPATPGTPTAAKAKVADIYNTTADARAVLKSAQANALKDNKRVLVMFGGNWCGWCHKLHDLFKKDRAISKELMYEYEIVMVDIGKWDKNLDLVTEFGADIKGTGVPYLTVLDGNGKVLANQATGPLENGPDHDPKKVLEFLTKYNAPQLDAATVVKEGIAKAAAERKMVFLHFGAPWCGWCHKLENWMAKPEINAMLAQEFVDVKIDEDRMTGGKDVEKQFKQSGGIPWFAFLDATGKVLTVSEAADPKTQKVGNIGFPAEPHEIAQFMKMLKETVKHLSTDQLAAIEASLTPPPKKAA